MNLAGTWVDIAHTGRCVLYMAAKVEYNSHCIVDISAVETMIRSMQYLRQNLNNCKYTGIDVAHCWHSTNRPNCAVFGSKCAVWRPSNCLHITNSGRYTINWILNPKYSKLQLQWNWQDTEFTLRKPVDVRCIWQQLASITCMELSTCIQ